MSNTILVVDDQSSIRQLLTEYLSKQGFRVLIATNGEEAIYTARHDPPDVILLDIMMPKMDGYQFLRQYRQERQTPVIILTAREEETDAVLGLELGADDYVIKPFRMRELVARIRAVLRRAEDGQDKFEVLRAGNILLDTKTHQVTVDGVGVALTPIEFDLLAILLRSPGRVFSRAELVDLLSEPAGGGSHAGFAGLDSTLNVHIRNLRIKVEADPAKPRHIETVFGIGYRLVKGI